MIAKGVAKCECNDLECQSDAHGPCSPCGVVATERLYRIDTEDYEGTPMCVGCADDAYSSGCFASESDVQAARFPHI